MIDDVQSFYYVYTKLQSLEQLVCEFVHLSSDPFIKKNRINVPTLVQRNEAKTSDVCRQLITGKVQNLQCALVAI